MPDSSWCWRADECTYCGIPNRVIKSRFFGLKKTYLFDDLVCKKCETLFVFMREERLKKSWNKVRALHKKYGL